MGKDCLQIFLNLKLTPEERGSVSSSLAALEAYFKPTTSVVYERYLFNSSTQGPEEGIDEFVNRLRKLASSCKFGTLTDETIRDRIVIGLQDKATKLRLLKEEELNLDKTLKICRASEIASKQLKSMKSDQNSEQVNALGTQARRQNKASHKRTASRKYPAPVTKETHKHTKKSCGRCGGPEQHKLEECKAYGQTCLVCKKPNHFASMCRLKDKHKSQRSAHRHVRQVLEERDSSEEEPTDSDDPIFKIEEISNVKTPGKQINVDLVFSDEDEQYFTELECQLDTGATCNVMSLRDVAVISQTGDPPLKTSKVKLRLFDGSLMKPCGVATLKIHRNGSIDQLDFQIVDTKNKPLLSAETCERLGLLKVTITDSVQVNSVASEQDKPGVPWTKENILNEYKDVFEGLGHIGDSSSFVINPDHTPVQHAPRRIPVTLQSEVKEKIAELEKKGIIQKVTEPTEWISSMVIVAKPGKIRICLDPRDLNKAIQRPKYQMPTLDEVLPRLSKAKVFTTLDAKDGFYQIGLDEGSSKKTTFWTPFGRYRYLRMPFGVSLAPEEFECRLHEKLAGLDGVEILRDDMLVAGYGDTQEEAEADHDRNLRKLLDRAREVNLKLNSKKMNLRKPQVKLMGHVISKDGLKPDPDKVKAVKDMPKPTCKQETLSLLGFVNYLAKFLPRLSEVAQPLRNLTLANAQFLWSQQHDKAFDEVKKLVVQHPVLKFYDVNEEVTLQCDASERGLGATLLQNGQPVAFASRTLSLTEQRYAQIEKECLAIVFGCQKFSQYISRREKVTVESDHKPLQSIFKKSLLQAPMRLQRMMLRLQRYNLDVVYKPGSQMFVADHLSRAFLKDTGPDDEEFQVFALELESMNPLSAIKISSERLPQLQRATEQDPVMQTLKTTILMGWPEHREEVPVHIREYWNFREELTLHNGILFKNQRVIIPKAMRAELTARAHSSHQGIEACIRRAKDVVFWPSMSKDIQEAVAKCEVCAEFQTSNVKQPMQSHELPCRPWSRVSSDLFTLNSKDYIVLGDSYSDFIEVGELRGTTSSDIITFLKEQFSRHGIPDVLVTDNGPQYYSREFTEFSTAWEFKHVTSSPTHAKSNGKAESAVKVAKKLFKKAYRDNKDPWLALLDQRNTPTQGVNSSPAQRLMSRRTRTLLPVSSNLLYPKVEEGVTEKLKIKRQKAKSYHDRGAKLLPELEVGQEVRVAGQRSKTWEAGTCVQKLSDRSYMVEVNGATVRRNREALRPKLDGGSITQRNVEDTVIETQATESAKAEEAPAVPSTHQSKGTAPVVGSDMQQITPSVPMKTTRTRIIRPPVRFKDYV